MRVIVFSLAALALIAGPVGVILTARRVREEAKAGLAWRKRAELEFAAERQQQADQLALSGRAFGQAQVQTFGLPKEAQEFIVFVEPRLSDVALFGVTIEPGALIPLRSEGRLYAGPEAVATPPGALPPESAVVAKMKANGNLDR